MNKTKNSIAFFEWKQMLAICLFILSFCTLKGQAIGDYGSSGSMNWSGGSWQVCTTAGTWSGSSSTTTPPSASSNVWILAGQTVSLTSSVSCANLYLSGTLSDGGNEMRVTGNVLGNGSIQGTGRLNISYVTSQLVPTVTNTSTTLTLSASNSSIAVGQLVSGKGIKTGTKVTAVSGTSVTISNATTAANTNVTVFFSNVRNSVGLNGAVLSVDNFEKSSAGLLGLSGNLSIAGDYFLAPTIAASSSLQEVSDSGNNIQVGGNIYNYSGNRADMYGTANNGWMVLTGTSTTSGLIGLGTVAAGTTSGFVVGDTVSIAGGVIPAIAVVSSVSSGAVTGLTVFDIGTGFTQAPTSFVAKSGNGKGSGTLTNAIVSNSVNVKYLATGFFYFRKLQLANTTPLNNLIENTGSTLQVMDTMSFAANNTSGTCTISSGTGLYLGGALWNTNIATAGSIIMSPTNYFRGGTSLAGAAGTIAYTNYSTHDITYFDPKANYFSKLQQLGENSGNINLGNSVTVRDLVAPKGGSIVVDSSAIFTIPASVTSTIGVTNGVSTGVVGTINGSAKGSKVILTGTVALPTGLFSPLVISNLSLSKKITATLNQSLTIADSLFLDSSSTLKIDTGYTCTISANTAGTGALNGSLGSVVMNGTTQQALNIVSAGNLTINNANGVIASPSVSGLLTITNGDISSYSNISNCNVLFNGSSAQLVNAGLTSINGLTVNNAQGISLNNPLSVNGVLTLTNGKITLGNNNLKVWATGSVISPSPSSSYIVTNGTGSLIMTLSSGVTNTFIVGTANSYNPVTLTPDSTSDFYVSVAIGNTPALPTTNATILPLQSLNRTWNITPNTPSATAITLGYDGVSDINSSFNNSGANVALLENAGGSAQWQYVSTGSVIPGAGIGTAKTASFSGVTSFSSFTIVNPGPGAVYNKGAIAKFSNIFRSATSGLWSSSSTWQLYDDSTSTWLSTVLTPTSTSTVTISSGNTVVLNGQAGVGILTIDSAAVLKSATNAYTAASVILSIGSPNAVIQNNGTFGCAIGSADTTVGDGITLSLASNCSSFSITGTGTTGIASLYPLSGSNNLSIVIDQNVQFRKSSATAMQTALSLFDPSGAASTGSRTLLIDSGITVSFLDSNSCLHANTYSSTISNITTQQGNWIYDIQGTLDLQGGNIYISSSSNAASSTQTVKLNIGMAGKVIAAGDFNFNKAQSTQAVYTYIEDGGLLDASGAGSKNTNDFGLSRTAITTVSLANINSNATVNVSAANGGYYTSVPTVTVSGISGGSGLTATAVLTGNKVTSIIFSGSNGAYTGTPIISFSSSTVGDLSWVVLGSINSTYKRYVTGTKVFNVAVPPASGDYSAIKGNSVQLIIPVAGIGDSYTVSVAKGVTPAPVTFSPNYAINRTWKVQPTNLRSGFDYVTFVTFGFTSGTEDANTSFSPTYPAFTYGTSSRDLNAGYAVAQGSLDLMMYRDFTKTWVLSGGYYTTNQPSVGNFGTTWQAPTQQGQTYFLPGFVLANFFPPYLFSIKNTAAPFICP